MITEETQKVVMMGKDVSVTRTERSGYEKNLLLTVQNPVLVTEI